MRLKKILIAAALLIVVFIAAVYVFLAIYDFNQLKPTIAELVKEATGRELTIAGDIDLKFGVPPIISVENVSFQNAAWGSRPKLGKAKKVEIQMAFLPLIWGNYVFKRIIILEPDFLLEMDATGTNNLTFETEEQAQEKEMTLPVLIFSDIQIAKGRFTYKDLASDLTFAVKIERLDAEIPGFDRSLQLDFEGAFDDIPLTISGTVGPIWSWIEPGNSLPADLTAGVGGANVHVKGELQDPIHFKNLAFDITAEGDSVADIAKLFGLTDVPDFGAFKLEAKVADPEGKLAVKGLDIHVGSEELAAISLNGAVKDLLALQGVNLNFAARGQDAANLIQLGIPSPPRRGAFRISTKISDIEANVFSASDLNAVLGENEVIGQVYLNLAEQVPFLTAKISSQQFEFGAFNLNVKLTGPVEKLAISKLDLKLGTPDLIEIQLTGIVDDVMRLHGVDINFQARGNNLANLKQLTGQPLPVRGAFNAAGKVIIPVHKKLKISELQIKAGKNQISGTVELDLTGPKPRLAAALSALDLVPESILPPEIAKQPWVKAIDELNPIQLVVKIAAIAQEISVEHLDLKAGSDKLAKLELKGSIQNLSAQRGIDLNFTVRGSDVANLKKFFNQPLPAQGGFSVSGHVTDPTAKLYKVSELKVALGENNLAGWLDINLAKQQPQLAAELSAPKFNLQPLSISTGEVLSRLKKVADLGPLQFKVKLAFPAERLAAEELDIQAGTADLAELKVTGTVKDLSSQQGIDLSFSIKGKNAANLNTLTGQFLPIQGDYAVSGRITDPAANKYKLSELTLILGENDESGWLEIDLSKERPKLRAGLSSEKFDLRSLLTKADKGSAAKDQSLKSSRQLSTSAPKNVKVFPGKPLQLEGLKVIDADIKLRNKQVLLANLALFDMMVDILLKNGNLEIKPFKFMIGDGNADIQFDLRSRDKPSMLAVGLQIDQLDLGQMLDQLGYQRSVEGLVDADVNLQSRGESIAVLMAGLNGDIRFAMVDGQAASKYLDLLQKYLGTDILRMLNPFQKKKKYAPINCFVNNIEINDGLVDVKLLLDTDQTSIFGAGNVNLKTEALNLGIKPTPKKGHGHSSVGTVSFSFKELSQPF